MLALGPATQPAPAPAVRHDRAWWIYGAAIGAVVVGATVVYLTTTGDDTQRYEVHAP